MQKLKKKEKGKTMEGKQQEKEENWLRRKARWENSKKSWKEESKRPEEEYKRKRLQTLGLMAPHELLKFRACITDADLDAVMEQYPQLLRDKLLRPFDSRRIARLLHYKYRAGKAGSKSEALESHVEHFRRDFVNRILPPHPRASLHLIGYYKESKNYDKGIEFWNWVVEQDDNYINLSTYGAAIELLTFYGKDLEYCEAVYKHALTRFAVHFNEYHLSPGAILPDRAQYMITSGTSMGLLQGILTARLLHRDWRNAYLTLDTALRIHPTQIPPRFIELFVLERPLQEAYQVFCVACRAGNRLPGSLLTTLLQNLSEATSNEDASVFTKDIVGAMFNAIHAFVGSTGRLETPHMNVLLKVVLSVLIPNDRTEPTQALSEREKDDGEASSMMKLFFEVFGAIGVSPENSTFNTLVRMGGDRKHKRLLAFAINAFKISGFSPDASTFRSLQIAAGRLHDPMLLKSSWTQFVRFVTAQGAEPDVNDWSAFVLVAKRAGMEDVVTELMSSNPQHMAPEPKVPESKAPESKAPESKAPESKAPESKAPQSKAPESKAPESKAPESKAPESKAPGVETKQDTAPISLQSSTELHAQDRSRLFEQISAELELLRKRLNSESICNLRLLPVNRISITSCTPSVDEDWQRRLYDELTLDLAAPMAVPLDETQETDKERPVVETTTGFPLDELRYLNWKSVNELLMQAEPFEARKELLVDEAMAQGKSVPNSPVKDYKHGAATLQAELKAAIAARTQHPTESEWRETILRLRRAGS
ncbi:hypothetical protein LPUS_12042 [Lasallia pustulata]|uniref:Uncharacterized protein n=1 Tax=Lasallia pustulata TaxID=136370 RepID=A0A1W5DDX0_9LECA|nr:hypothetical protein LPUS_12042 [Lasallia pustulata]